MALDLRNGRRVPPEIVDELVGREVEVFFDRQRTERLRLYRALLQGTVRHASPLALDLIAQAGSTVAQVAEALPLPVNWPRAPLRHRPVGAMLRARRSCGSSLFGPSRFPKVASHGVLLRDRRHPLGELGVWTSGDRLEAVACPGGCVLHSVGDGARLHVPTRLPETLIASLPGRRVEDVVSHPALDGRGYVVRRAQANPRDDAVVIAFATGTVSLELPWAEALDALVEADRGA